jgi:(2Fe-2S) ferredoxin
MNKITKADLDRVASRAMAPEGPYIKVGMSSCGIAAGADEVFKALETEALKRKIPITVKPCGCSGACYAEPLVEVSVEGLPSITYGRVNPEIAMRILEEHVEEGRMVHDFIVDLPMRRKQ